MLRDRPLSLNSRRNDLHRAYPLRMTKKYCASAKNLTAEVSVSIADDT